MLSLMLTVVVAQASAADGSSGSDAGFEPIQTSVPEADGGTPALVVSDAEGPAPSGGFVKGELSVYLGSDRLSVKRNRIGVSAGLDRFGNAYYLLLEPQVDLRFFDAKLGIGVGAPLRLELVNFDADPATHQPYGTSRLFRVRTEDWSTFHDYGRLLKYVNFGKKEDNLYINVGQRYSSSIGHGTVMRRYAPNIDVDYPRVSAEVDAYNDYGGFELLTNDVLEWNLLSGIAFLKPLSFFKPQNLLARTFSVGVTGATDWKAPMALLTNDLGVRQLDALNHNRLMASTHPVGFIGVDAEVKVVKTDSVDIKPYVDYSMLLGGGGGFTAGALGRFNLGTRVVNAFRVVAELRYLNARYQPQYFDTFYEVDRYQATQSVARNAQGFFDYQTKQQQTLSGDLGTRGGYYLEASWGIPGKVGVTVAVEGVTNAPELNFLAHLEVPWLNFVQLFASFYKRGIKSGAEFLSFNNNNTIAYAGARLRVLPFLFVNGRVYKTFRVNPDVQRYDNQFGFVADLEIGYEFGRSRDDAPEPDPSPVQTPASEAPAAPETPAPAPEQTPALEGAPTPASST